VALTQAAAEVRLAKEEGEIFDRAKTEFLANISHELKTPLNAVIGFSELMAAETLGPIGTPQYKEYAEQIRDSGLYLVDIVNDILDVSHLEANTVEADENDIHIEDAVVSGLRLVADRARESEISLSVALPPDLPVLVADSQKHEGTGLGLTLVNSMMLLHGGKLVLESELGAGTTATLRFPAELTAGNHHGLPAEAADMPPLQAEIRAA
jgi:signal transduction histidine kinase